MGPTRDLGARHFWGDNFLCNFLLQWRSIKLKARPWEQSAFICQSLYLHMDNYTWHCFELPVLAMFPCIARMRKTWPMLSTPSCWDKIVLEDLSRGIYGDEFQGWNPLQMLKWLQGLLPSRGAVVINRSVHPDFLNFLIHVKQPYIHTHSLTQMRRWVHSHSLIHSPTFIYMCKWVYLLVYIYNILGVCPFSSPFHSSVPSFVPSSIHPSSSSWKKKMMEEQKDEWQ